MSRSRLAVISLLLATLVLASPAPPAPAAPPSTVAAPPIALLASSHGRTELFVVRAGDRTPGPVLAAFDHVDGSVRGALLPDGSVLAAAPVRADSDRSFDGGLWRLETNGRARLLCDALTHASRPLSADGRAFVVRGATGAAPVEGAMRVDELTVDEVDPASGALVTLHRYRGYLVHLAGFHDGRVVAYRVGPGVADIVAIEAAGGAVSSLLPSLPPFARDFSLAGDRLVFRGRDERDASTWVIDALDVGSSARQRLFQGASFTLTPHAWPDGGVAFNARSDGLALLGSSDPVRAPLGAGVDVVRAISGDARFVAAVHTEVHSFEVPFVLERALGVSARLPAPLDRRIDIVGFVERNAP
jgi:hypothetical protein